MSISFYSMKIFFLVQILLCGGVLLIRATDTTKIHIATAQETEQKLIVLVDDRLALPAMETSAQTVEQFLANQHVELSSHDYVFPSLKTALQTGMTIFIERAKSIEITVDGRTVVAMTTAPTVSAATDEQGIFLAPDDRITPALATPLSNNTRVTITRVTITQETVTKSIPYNTIVTENDSLGWRIRTVTEKGQNGTRQIVYDIYRHDGVEVRRVAQENTITKEPATERVVQGTHVKIGKSHAGLGTWYAHTGTLAAASPWLPFGSYVKVTNRDNGKSVIVVIHDRGPFGKNRIIDLDKVAFEEIASLGAGVINVKVEEILN